MGYLAQSHFQCEETAQHDNDTIYLGIKFLE